MGAREQILDAADQMFGKVGFEAATTREIAELSGVNKALIHYHFKSKDQLFTSVLDRYYEKLTALLMKNLSSKGSAEKRLASLVDVYGLKMSPVGTPEVRRKFEVFTRRGRSLSPAAQSFLDFIGPKIRSMPHLQ